jgi:hypothetical protein
MGVVAALDTRAIMSAAPPFGFHGPGRPSWSNGDLPPSRGQPV